VSAADTLESTRLANGARESEVRALVHEHLGTDPSRLPMLSERYPEWQDINVQAALEAYCKRPGRTARMVGVSAVRSPGTMMSLFTGLAPNIAGLLSLADARLGAVEYEQKPSGVGAVRACVKTALLLASDENGPLVLWIHEEGRRPARAKGIDVLAGSVEQARAFFAEFRQLLSENNQYRGQFVRVIDDSGVLRIEFEQKPTVDRDEVILPPGVLEALEGHSVRIGRRARRLASAKRHLKRGLLLYGPPGTGKTHTVRYLASQLPDYTVFLLAGSGMGWLGFVKSAVADLAPMIVVLDDVDLIAEDRSLPGLAPRAFLFSLLDAMDGTREDADVLFVCTSNRVETLEKAISARPGRIDHAVELGLPDAACRRRLLELYSDGIDLQLDDLDAVITQTDGVTASFIKELLRRSWLAARADASSTVRDRHVQHSLDELLAPDSPLTPALLGVAPEIAMQRVRPRGVGDRWNG
jgi:hypothetical protein